MSERRFDLIIFDKSGTLDWDVGPVHEANNRMCRHYGVEPILDRQAWLRQSSSGPAPFFQERGVGATEEEIFNLYQQMYDEAVADGHHPYLLPGVHQVLAKLKRRGKALAVISAHPEQPLFEELSRYRIDNYFVEVIGGVRNKERVISEFVSDLPNYQKNILYIGDTVGDIRAARAAGVSVAAVLTGYHTREQLQPENPWRIWPSVRSALKLL